MAFAKKTTADKASASAAGKTTAAAAKKPRVKQTYLAKFGFKPMIVEMNIFTNNEGLVSNKYAVKFLRGSAKNPKLAVFPEDISFFDTKDTFSSCYIPEKNKSEGANAIAMTMLQLITAATFAVNPARRLPKNRRYTVKMRVSVRKDNTVAVSIREIAKYNKNAAGKMTATALDRKEDEFKKLRKAAKYLPAAFQNICITN